MYIKKHYQIIEFAFIVSFFVIPPLMTNPVKGFVFSNSFSTAGIIYFLMSLILYFQETWCNMPERKVSVFFKNVVNSSYFFKTFGLLVVFAATLDFILEVLHVNSIVQPSFESVNILLVILIFLLTSFSEEIIYRLYLPSFLHRFIKAPTVVLEAVPVLVFALAHRYMGYAPVINALFAGVVLRRCYVKSSSILTTFFAHFAYNVFMFFLYYCRLF